LLINLKRLKDLLLGLGAFIGYAIPWLEGIHMESLRVSVDKKQR